MYTKPIIYKVYSVISLVSSLSAVVYSFISYAVITAVLSEYAGVWLVGYIPFAVGIPACLSLFFALMEFSSMYTFAQMIEHEQSGDKEPFKRRGIVFAPALYRVFGTVVYFATTAFQTVTLLTVIVLCAVVRLKFWSFFFIVLGTLVISAAFNVLCYLQYFCRYRTFGTLLAVKSTAMATDATVRALGSENPNHLRGYCSFLYGFGLFAIVVSLLSILFIGVAGVWTTIAAVICFLPLSVIGCYFDNLAMMQEHYMIKYKLFDY